MRIEATVPIVDSLSKAQFAELFLSPHRPVILRGMTKEWNAHSLWSTDYLRAKIGDKKVRVKESPSNVHPDLFSSTPSRSVETTISDYIDLLASDRPERTRRYLNGDESRILHSYTEVDPAFAPLRSDIAVPDYCDSNQIKTIGLWLSAQDVIASLHYDSDGCHNLNVQVKGKKRVLLFSPDQFLYPFSGTGPSSGPQNFSQINIADPDEGRFPALRSARCLEAILEEGDMLFIPSYWYHAVFHLGRININVNFWWPPDHFRLTKTSFRATFLSLLNSALADGRRFANEKQGQHATTHLSLETRRLLQSMEDLIGRQYRI